MEGLYWFGLIVFSAIVGIWMLMSVLWAPVAAFVCMRHARALGYDVRYYGLVGALYSTFLVLPWLYLTNRLSGERTPTSLIVIGYFIAYMVWIISLGFTYFSLYLENRGLATLVMLVSVTLLLASIFSLRREPDYLPPSSKYGHRLSDFFYVAPFAFATAQATMLHWSRHYTTDCFPIGYVYFFCL